MQRICGTSLEHVLTDATGSHSSSIITAMEGWRNTKPRDIKIAEFSCPVQIKRLLASSQQRGCRPQTKQTIDAQTCRHDVSQPLLRFAYSSMLDISACSYPNCKSALGGHIWLLETGSCQTRNFLWAACTPTHLALQGDLFCLNNAEAVRGSYRWMHSVITIHIRTTQHWHGCIKSVIIQSQHETLPYTLKFCLQVIHDNTRLVVIHTEKRRGALPLHSCLCLCKTWDLLCDESVITRLRSTQFGCTSHRYVLPG